MTSSKYGAPKYWGSVSSGVHICASEYWQLIMTCTSKSTLASSLVSAYPFGKPNLWLTRDGIENQPRMFPCKMFHVKMFQFKNVRVQHDLTRSRQFRRSASHSPRNSSRTTSRIRSRVGPDLDLPYKLSCQKISVRHCAVMSLSKYLGNLFFTFGYHEIFKDTMKM